MRRVYAIGETVLDIIFRNLQVVDAKPGGSMLNTSVSLGRAGINIHFITEYANDQVGNMVQGFLEGNGVNCSYVYHYDQGKTGLAMAFLDEKSDASYVFYKSYPTKRLALEMPDFQPDDIFLFGSFFGIDPGIREFVVEMVRDAKSKGAIVIYDPNFRKSHVHELEKLKPVILENIQMANIVRGSHEDFHLIFNAISIQDVRDNIGYGPEILIMTKSSEAVFMSSKNFVERFGVQPITPVSTIGAGDNFNAGLIFGLLKENVLCNDLESISSSTWERITKFGVAFATDVCMSYENYISEAFVKTLK